MFKSIKNWLLVAAIAVPSFTAVSAQDVSGENREAIETIIQEYLLEHPEVIERAIIELQRRRQLAQMLPAINLYRGYLENEPEAPVLGNPDGDVTIVEFFDYRCGYCRRHFPEVLKLVKEDGNIRYIPRQYPVLDREGDTPVSRLTSYAALAAHKQGKFEQFHIAAMTAPGQLTEDRIYEIATSVGLDVTRLKADMKDKLVEKSIRNTLSIGQDIGFTGTPGYIIGDDVVLGAEGYFRLLEAVDRARKENTAD